MAIYEIYIDEGILASDSNIIGVGGIVIENTQSSDEFLKNLFKVSNISEIANISDLTSSNRGVFVTNNENISMQDSLNVNSILNIIINEGAIFYFTGGPSEGVYEAWVVNARTGASWRYDNYKFDSFAVINGKYVGCRYDGIYEIDTGESDDGEEIRSIITTGITTGGSALKKSYDYAYAIMSNDGKMYMKVLANGVDYMYEFKQTSDYLGGARAQLGRGLKANAWQFELVNDGGSNFDIEALLVYPLLLSRHV